MRESKFAVGDAAYYLQVDTTNDEVSVVLHRCRIKKVIHNSYTDFVELEREIDGKWVNFRFSGQKGVSDTNSFPDDQVYKTRKEMKTAAVRLWDRTAMYKKELDKLNKKIELLLQDRRVLEFNKSESELIVEKIKEL